MTWEVTITATNQIVETTVTSTNITVTPPTNSSFTITDNIFNVGVTNVESTVTAYYNAIQIRLSTLNTFWRGQWVSGTGYTRGDIVEDEYSLYVLKDFSVDITEVYTSTIQPKNDPTYWTRIIWKEAPFAHLTVTNFANIGTNLSVGGNSFTGGNAGIVGNAVITGTVAITGDTTIANQLQIGGNTRISGITTVSNTLDVLGTSTFDKRVVIGTSLSVGTTATIGNATRILGTLDVAQTSTLNDTNILGNVDIGGNVSAGKGLTIASTATFNGATTFNNTVRINNPLIVTASSTFTNTTRFENTATFTGFIQASGSANISNSLTTVDLYASSLQVGGNNSGKQLYIKGNSQFDGDLEVLGRTSLNTTTITTASALIVQSSSTFSGNARFNGTTEFYGTATFNNTNTYVKNIFVDNNLVVGDVYYPTNKGLNTQFLMSDGAGQASWQYLGVGTVWTLFTDLTTRNYNIKSGKTDNTPNNLVIWTGGDPAIQSEAVVTNSKLELNGNGTINLVGNSQTNINGLRVGIGANSSAFDAITLQGNVYATGPLRANGTFTSQTITVGGNGIFSGYIRATGLEGSTSTPFIRNGVNITSGNATLDANYGLVLSTNGFVTLGANSNITLGNNGYVQFGDGTRLTSAVLTSSAVLVYDEGNLITAGLTSLNFVGAAITATNQGGAVTVNVSAGNAVRIEDEGNLVTNTATTINFIGTGVNATLNGNTVNVNVTGAPGPAGPSITVFDENTQITTAARVLRFTGPGVTLYTNPGGSDDISVDIPGTAGNVSLTQDALTNGYKIKDGSTYLLLDDPTATLQGWTNVILQTEGTSITLDKTGNNYSIDLQGRNITVKGVNAYSDSNFTAITPNVYLNPTTQLKVNTPSFITSATNTQLTSSASMGIRGSNVRITATNTLTLNAASIQFDGSVNFGSGTTLISGNPVRIGNTPQTSNLHVERIYNRDGNGPPLFPSGVRYPDGTVQYTAFVPNLGVLPPLIKYKGTVVTATLANFNALVPVPEYFDAVVALDTQHVWVYTVLGPIGGWFDASA